MIQKRLSDISAEDIHRLIDERRPEAFDLEFKMTIPTESGEPDRWIARGDRVGRGAAKILREIVAFANARGGTLVLGIDESDDDPRRALKITPLPRCEELAERFSAMMRDDIEPRLPFLECRGVPMSADGSGVVVIRAPPSLIGPHWVASTRDATIRHGAHSMSMTMTEIQDLTLKLTRDSDAVTREFHRRAKGLSLRFGQNSATLEGRCNVRLKDTGLFARAMALGATAVPLAPALLPSIVQDSSLRLDPSILAGIGNIQGQEICMPNVLRGSAWRPMLRGIRMDELGGEHLHWRELGETGIVELGWIDTVVASGENPISFPLDQLLWSVAFLLFWVELVRSKAAAPYLPFGLSINLRCSSNRFIPVPSSRPWAYRHRNCLEPQVNFPLYRIASRDEFEPILRQLSNDFFNAGGSMFTEPLELTLAPVFDRIDEFCKVAR
jgi:hypothetical protein